MLSEFAELTGHASKISKVPEAVRLDAVMDMMVGEAIKTSEAEGDYLIPRLLFRLFAITLALIKPL